MKLNNINQLMDFIYLLYSKEELYGFFENNIQSLKKLVMPKAHVKRYQEGLFYSECDYEFRKEESDWTYCAGCLEELACCDNPDFCDLLNIRLTENVWSMCLDFYYRTRKNKLAF